MSPRCAAVGRVFRRVHRTQREDTVILVDDGLATGTTMRAAVLALRAQQPARLVVAVPLAALQTCAALRDEVDEIICALTPEPFGAVGLWYEDFTPTSDEEVRTLLGRAAQDAPPRLSPTSSAFRPRRHTRDTLASGPAGGIPARRGR